MVTFSQSILRIKPSQTLETQATAKRLLAAGRDVVSLVAGEPDFDTPEHVKDAAREALKNGFTKYTEVNGILSLREAIADKLKRDQRLNYSPEEIVVTNGGKQAIATAMSVLLNPGDEVIIPCPYWTSYPDIVELCGGKPVFVETTPNEGYVMNPDALRRAVSPRTKMIILNSPSNPTGACYTEADLKGISEVIAALKNRSEVIILLDEVYEYITFDGYRHLSFATLFPEHRDNILLVNAFSKSYSMTGWRVGYVAGPLAIIKQIGKHQSQFTSNVCSISQYAASRAYDDQGEFPQMLAREFAKRLEVVIGAISDIPGLALPVKPKGAFFVFFRVEGLFGKKAGERVIASAQEFAKYLLEDFNLSLLQGEAFGDNGGIRLSFAAEMGTIKEALSRLGSAVSALR